MENNTEARWGFIGSLLLHAILLLLMIRGDASGRGMERVQPVVIAQPAQGKAALLYQAPAPPVRTPSIHRDHSERSIYVRKQVLAADERNQKGNDEPLGFTGREMARVDGSGKEKTDAQRGGLTSTTETEREQAEGKEEPRLDGLLAIPDKPWVGNKEAEAAFRERQEASDGGREIWSEDGKKGHPQGYLSTHPAWIEGVDFPGLEGYDLSPWATRFVARIRQNWRVPLAVQIGVTGTCVVRFELNTDGQVLTWSCSEHSGVSSYDAASVEALLHSAPFPPLPRDFPNPRLVGQIRFLYGVRR